VEARSARELEAAEAELVAAEASASAAEAVHRSWALAVERLSGTAAPRHPEEAFLDLEVRAPISGRLVAAPTGPGGWVDASELVFEILDTAVLHYLVRLPEQEIGTLEDPRTRVELGGGRTFDLPGEEGELRLSRPLIDPRTRTGEIVYEAPNAAGLSPGAVRQGWLAAGPPRDALAVPPSALVDEDGLDVVFVQVSGELFERRVVRTGVRDGERIEILEGVRPGERVVASGAFVIRLASLSGAIPEHSH
jgi:cobalt-zinc-cadmium efflux system membrane fusion protein